MHISHFFNPPVFAVEQQTREAKTLHFVVWSLLIVFDTQFFVFFFLLPENWPRWLGILLTINFTLPPLLLMNRQGRTRMAGTLLLSMLWTLATVSAYTARGIHAMAILAYLVFVLIAGLLFGGRAGVIAGIIFGFTALALALLAMAGLLPKNRINYTALSIWVTVAMCLEFIAIFQFMANRSITAALARASEAEQRYREVYETASDGVFLYDVTTDGRYIGYGLNPIYEKMLGITSTEFVGRTPEQAIGPDAARALVVQLKHCVAQGFPISVERTISSLSGQSFHLYTTFIPVKDATGRVYRMIGVSRDITLRKEAEAALRRSRDELEVRVQERTAELRDVNAELQKVNKELDAFSYSVSHDLRRPLRTITGFSDLLMSEHASELSGDSQNLVTLIKDSAFQMNQLIEALLDLSHVDRQPLMPRPVNLTALVNQTIKELRAEQPDRNVDIRVADLPDCMGDPSLLHQVFANLLSNALKYTRNRSKAVIEIGFKNGHEDAMTTYYVRDNGAGFDMRHADKLFGVFQRLHSAQEFSGTGVGLSIVRRIVHRHGGKIWAEAEVDKGATFYFTLPQASPYPLQTSAG